MKIKNLVQPRNHADGYGVITAPAPKRINLHPDAPDLVGNKHGILWPAAIAPEPAPSFRMEERAFFHGLSATGPQSEGLPYKMGSPSVVGFVPPLGAPPFSATALYWAVICAVVGSVVTASANPAGLSVGSGVASAVTTGSHLNVAVGSPLALLNWSSFNIAAGETTRFLQPSSGAVVINEIGGASASQIYGSLTANGTVILANQHGFYFGPNSYVAVGGNFIATTAPLPPDIGVGGAWQFTGPPPLASIVNYGQINVGQGKSLFLIAENLQNSGTLKAPGGNIGLAAGQSVLLSDRADGRGLALQVKLPEGSVDNEGKIIADGGTITANAQVINQNGILQADSVQNQNGVIELTAADTLNLGANSQILARGNADTPGNEGGAVTLRGGDDFSDNTGSVIETSSSASGGQGGSVDISAPNILSLDSAIDAGAFILDPENITLSGSGSTSYPGGTVNASGSGTLTVNVDTAFSKITAASILLEATGNITLTTPWNLSATTSKTTGQLTLEAGGNITLGSTTTSYNITDANDWSVTLEAGYNFTSKAVTSGTGSILLDSSSSIQTSQGSISLTAGNNITLGSGAVCTYGGGSIFAHAIAGTLNCGTDDGVSLISPAGSDSGGYDYNSSGYTVSPNLGGISTAAGGNVTLEAGQNVTYVPSVPFGGTPGFVGAYGPEAGNVTVIAGNEIFGNYLVANGTGLLEAGVTVQNGQVTQISNPNASIGTTFTGQQVYLGLISGSWNAYAADNINLAEVLNPNGSFNGNENYLNNYASGDSVAFWAGNAMNLGLARNVFFPGSTQNVANYPASLTLTAGAGGITLLDKLDMLSSSQASQYRLNITTLNGGNLNGGPPNSSAANATTALIMQGSPLTFEYDPTPRVNLDISGSIGNIDSITLQVPDSATLKVAGDIDDFVFQGQNDSAAGVTTIGVAGNIVLGNYGALSVSGPGAFNINVAGNVDLGSATGIFVNGPTGYAGAGVNQAVLNTLLGISPYGANLDIQVQGNFTMVQTSIINMGINGGINLNVGGELDVGSGNFNGSNNEGIFTTSGGNVSVNAVGNVDVDGSRIASYDGGNISVVSQTGDVNAGQGGQGGSGIYLAYLDANGAIESGSKYISGSGILATTIEGSPATVGDITVDATKGSINASSGGIAQLAFNENHAGAFIDLDAGQDINAANSGVIGYNLNLKAGGSINGLFIGAGNVNVNSGQNFSGTLIGSGSVTVSAGGSISGSIVGGGDISASGSTITASLISSSVSASGNTTGAAEGIPTAGVIKEVAPQPSPQAANPDDLISDWLKKKKKTLLTGQVTVVLPKT